MITNDSLSELAAIPDVEAVIPGITSTPAAWSPSTAWKVTLRSPVWLKT